MQQEYTRLRRVAAVVIMLLLVTCIMPANPYGPEVNPVTEPGSVSTPEAPEPPQQVEPTTTGETENDTANGSENATTEGEDPIINRSDIDGDSDSTGEHPSVTTGGEVDINGTEEQPTHLLVLPYNCVL